METQGFDLLCLLQQDKRKATEVIFRLYYPRLHAYATKVIQDRQRAEDMVADVFAKLCQLEPVFTTRQELEAYLFISLKHTCYNYLRQLRQFRGEPIDEQAVADIPGHEEYARFDDSELLEQAFQAIDQLTPAVKTVVLLRYKGDMKPKEIAARLGITIATVRTQLRDGMKQLRKMFGINTLLLIFYVLAIFFF